MSFPGSDKGSALFISVALILVLSLLFLSLVPYIISMEKNAGIYKDRVFGRVIDENREILREHDLH
jgi:hypothetical protein